MKQVSLTRSRFGGRGPGPSPVALAWSCSMSKLVLLQKISPPGRDLGEKSHSVAWGGAWRRGDRSAAIYDRTDPVKRLHSRITSIIKIFDSGSDCVTNICCCVTNKSNMLVNTGTGTWHWQRRCEACTSVSNRFPSCLGAHPTHFHAFCDPDITIIVTNKYNIMSQKIQSQSIKWCLLLRKKSPAAR